MVWIKIKVNKLGAGVRAGRGGKKTNKWKALEEKSHPPQKQNLKETQGNACVSVANKDKSDYNAGNVKESSRMALTLRYIVRK